MGNFFGRLESKKKFTLIEYLLFTETTGLNLQKDQICQISAVSEGDVIETGIKIPGILPGVGGQMESNPFNIYLRPVVEFNSKASEINGMATVITLQEPDSI